MGIGGMPGTDPGGRGGGALYPPIGFGGYICGTPCIPPGGGGPGGALKGGTEENEGCVGCGPGGGGPGGGGPGGTGGRCAIPVGGGRFGAPPNCGGKAMVEKGGTLVPLRDPHQGIPNEVQRL
eukprot:Sspe_Gene.50621::Locus_28163_Transcript_1_1_Confidence_1.000_Length_1631::g.50621::m.50621